MRNNQCIVISWVANSYRQFNELLPDVKLVGNADERLEKADCATWVLLCQEDLVLHSLLPLTILVESHHCNARLLTYGHLDVDPLV